MERRLGICFAIYIFACIIPLSQLDATGKLRSLHEWQLGLATSLDPVRDRSDGYSRLDQHVRDSLIPEDSRRRPLGSQRRPQLVLMLRCTRVREGQVLEEVLGRLLVLLLADDDVRVVGVLAL